MSEAASKADLVRSNQALKSRLARFREQSQAAARTSAGVALTVVGGGVAGALAARLPYIPGTSVSSPVAIGSVLVIGAAAGWFDEQSETVAQVGAGMIAAVAARQVEVMLRA